MNSIAQRISSRSQIKKKKNESCPYSPAEARSHRLFLDLVALVAGIALPFAFAPFFISFLSIVAPALLCYTWLQTTAKIAFRRGLLFGIGFFSVGISWVYVSIHVFGQASILLTIIITAIFVIYLAGYFGLQGFVLTKIAPQNDRFKILLLFPTSWVLFEALRGWLFTGFPWLFIGYSHTTDWLGGFGPIVGIYGVSFISLFLSSLLLIALSKKSYPLKHRIVASSYLLLILLSSLLLTKIAWTEPTGRPLMTTLVQGNIEQELKWQPEQFMKTFNLYQAYTQKHWRSDLIIWPEAALTLPLNQIDNLLTSIALQAKQEQATIITGVPIVQPNVAFNGMVALGNGYGIYHKRHLVPFGEYTPLKFIYGSMLQAFDIPMSNFARGASHQQPLMAAGIPIAPYICYEVAYPIEFLAFLPKAALLLTITDDSWFGHSIAAAQHLQMAQFRSLETGRYMLFSSNTGRTAIINEKGLVIKSIPDFQEGSLTTWVQPMKRATPWVIWQNIPLACIILLILARHFFRRLPVWTYTPQPRPSE